MSRHSRRFTFSNPTAMLRGLRPALPERAVAALAITSILGGLLLATPGRSAEIVGIGELHPNSNSFAWGVSPDGSTVVGCNTRASGLGLEPIRWDAENGIQSLGTLHPDHNVGCAHGASNDGSVIVGVIENGNSWNEAFRWEESGGMVGLGDLPGGDFGSFAYAVSSDGDTVAGFSWWSVTRGAFYWTPGSGMQQGPPQYENGGWRWSQAHDISADGSTIVGYIWGSGSAQEAMLWSQADGLVRLGVLPGHTVSSALAISADGSVVVGVSYGGGIAATPFIWDAVLGMRALGTLEGQASDVSADGSVVVGSTYVTGTPTNGGGTPWIWDEVHGMRWLEDVLIEQGADLSPWSCLNAPTGISANGRTIVGRGCRAGRYEGYVATLDAAVTEVSIDIRPRAAHNRVDPFSNGTVAVAVLGSSEFDPTEIDPTTLAFGPNGAAPVEPDGGWLQDVDGDGWMDQLAGFSIPDTGIALGDTEACLDAELLDGTPVVGCDTIVARRACGLGFEAAVVLWPLMAWKRGRGRRRAGTTP